MLSVDFHPLKSIVLSLPSRPSKPLFSIIGRRLEYCVPSPSPLPTGERDGVRGLTGRKVMK
jgi:hypothetical protein